MVNKEKNIVEFNFNLFTIDYNKEKYDTRKQK